jgi:RNA polymerase sigma-70 factor (ECF subfamily)
MVVARRLDEFEGKATMRTWLFAIAMRVAQSVRRDAAREIRRRERLVRGAAEHSHDPHDAADAAHTLQELLEHLDDDKRAVFVMAELEGMTAPEIAAAIGGKVATVYSRLRLARATLERIVARSKARDERGPR